MPKKSTSSTTPKGSSAYERKKQTASARTRAISRAGREIGPLPKVKNPRRRKKCQKSLQKFCETYFPNRFFWPFGKSHIEAINRMERVEHVGGLFALAMPRGSGKTTLAECAALHAILYGLRRYVVILAATGPLAESILKKIQREIETNPLLLEDFPEVCYPVKCLERIINRTRGQTLNGLPTDIEWNTTGLVFPTVPGKPSSGGIIEAVGGMGGAVRGLCRSGPDGDLLRPDLVLIDDPQTRETAKSPVQTRDREQVISDDVLGLAGPGTSIAAFMLCTVIYPGDLSDRFLDREKHPAWQGIRTAMLEAFPTNLELWDEYGEIRRDSLRDGDEGARATAFYVEHREAMDLGARVSWDERMKPGEVSAIQGAMNLYTDNPRGFRAEYQNEPESELGSASSKELQPEQIASRLSGLDRFAVPREAQLLTAFIDVGAHLHWYAVVAWSSAFGGSVIDYGCWPRQSRTMFAADDYRPGLQQVYPQLSESQAVYAGLESLTKEILGRLWIREQTGEELRVERCLIDSGWQSDTVHKFCRQSSHAGVIYPSKGVGKSATSGGISNWKPRAGEKKGYHWRLTQSESGRGRMAQFDPDTWKTFLWERLTEPMGGKGCLTMFGTSAGAHEMLAHHLAAEYSEPVTFKGVTFDKWLKLPHNPDNHLLDCVVGACVAASVQGLQWNPTDAPVVEKKKKKINIEDLYSRAKG